MREKKKKRDFMKKMKKGYFTNCLILEQYFVKIKQVNCCMNELSKNFRNGLFGFLSNC